MQRRDAVKSIPIPLELYRELERLSLLHERSGSFFIRHVVEIHYSDAAVSALFCRCVLLARLESELGDAETLQDQIAEDSRAILTGRAR